MENNVFFDYFAFSSKIDSPYSLIQLLNLNEENWLNSKGFHGYRQQLYCGGIHIHFDGQDNMGVCLEMSGSGCRMFEDNGGNFIDLIRYCLDNNDEINITRIDVSYDDFTGCLDLYQIESDIVAGNYRSRFRAFPIERIHSKSIDKRTFTIYCGSKQSEIMFRIYDKKAEQKVDCAHWVRFEIQLRRERAEVFAGLCIENSINSLFRGVIVNYLTIVENNESDSNISRAVIKPYWLKFLDDVSAVKLTKQADDYTTSNLQRFVERQLPSALVAYIALFGFDEFLELLNRRSRVKLNVRHQSLLDKAKLDVIGNFDSLVVL